jgi:undecaprenyl-diphosphatase
MEVWEAIVLGIVQGLTEFLPISSSGHLKAMREVLGFQELGLTFDVFVHLATLVAVVLYFWRDLVAIATGKVLWPVTVRLTIATAPIFLVGYLAESYLESLTAWAVVGGWVFSGIYLLLTRGLAGAGKYAEMSVAKALAVGLVQCVALFPGVSRSGSTITAGLWLGIERTEAARFSFLLAIPAILGASCYKGLQLFMDGGGAELFNTQLAIAMVASFVVGLVAIHCLLIVVRSNGFYRFAWYNFAAAGLFALYLWQSPAAPVEQDESASLPRPAAVQLTGGAVLTDED